MYVPVQNLTRSFSLLTDSPPPPPPKNNNNNLQVSKQNWPLIMKLKITIMGLLQHKNNTKHQPHPHTHKKKRVYYLHDTLKIRSTVPHSYKPSIDRTKTESVWPATSTALKCLIVWVALYVILPQAYCDLGVSTTYLNLHVMSFVKLLQKCG